MATRLYDWSGSPNGRKVRALAIELGIDLPTTNLDLMKGEQFAPEFLAKNPNGKVPVLEEDGWYLNESGAILAYLADKHPGKGLYPTDARLRAETLRWICWDQAHFASQSVFAVALENYRHQMGEGDIRPDVIEVAQSNWKRFATVLNNALEGRDWLVGDRFTIADLAVAGTLVALTWAPQLDLAPYPRIKAYIARLDARDSWRRTAPQG